MGPTVKSTDKESGDDRATVNQRLSDGVCRQQEHAGEGMNPLPK